MIPRIHMGKRRVASGGGGGTWTPEDLTFGSDDAFYSADTSDNFTFSSGTNISQWDDLSGNDLHLSVGGGTPTHDSTNKHVNFASGDYMHNTTTYTRDATITLVVGFRGNSSSNSHAVASINSTGADWTLAYKDVGSSDYEFVFWRNNASNEVETSSFNGSQDSGFNIYAVSLRDGGSTLSEVAWDNVGTSSGDVDVRLNGDDATLSLSGSTGGTYSSGLDREIGNSDRVSPVFVGEVEFMLFINGTISLSNLKKVEGWWAHTFSHTSELPSDHPYKSSAP